MNELVDYPIEEKKIRLGSEQLTIYVADLDFDLPDYYRLTLSSDEIMRANRLKSNLIRNRWTKARFCLRLLLGLLLHMKPEAVKLALQKNGKPTLSDPRLADFHFNLSHSEKRAVYVFSNQRNVGIDLEKVNPIPEMRTIAQQFFSKKEFELLSLRTDQIMDFFRIWTRKEAVLKAIGSGFTINPGCFSVFSDPVLITEGKPDQVIINGSNCSVTNFLPDDGYIGALALFDRE